MHDTQPQKDAALGMESHAETSAYASHVTTHLRSCTMHALAPEDILISKLSAGRS